MASPDAPSCTLETLPFDEELLPGARNAVATCLAVEQAETVLLITDLHTREIAASLLQAIRERGAPYRYFVLEELADRPLRDFPAGALAALRGAEVAISCFFPQPGEIGSRRQLIEVIEDRHIRYAHMVWISHEIMCQAMRADYREVDALSRRVLDRLREAEQVTVKSPDGTHIEVTCRPEELRWIKTSGLIEPDYWSNLPGGEVWTTPALVNGTFVVNGSVGDYLCPKYGDIGATPLTLEIEDSRLREVRCARQDLRQDFLSYCRQEENGDRVGEFAIGTNIGVTRLIGNLLQDEKVPGVHIAFGNPYGSQTGASWNCGTHIDAITRHCHVWAGSEQIMAAGQFLV